jgi:hypothetical protein
LELAEGTLCAVREVQGSVKKGYLKIQNESE